MPGNLNRYSCITMRKNETAQDIQNVNSQFVSLGMDLVNLRAVFLHNVAFFFFLL